ncbi:MAG: hypothetical protein ACQETI_00885 [Halobacteriota archaeon]
MSDRPAQGEAISVSDGDITVEKSFTADEFPVPAIKFDIRSERTEPVTVQLTDQIPEDFPMDGVGFHPDYGSEYWTAYKDHRVEFTRTLDGGQRLTTVYGIRLEDSSEVPKFLGEPYLEQRDVDGFEAGDAESVGDIIGSDNSQIIRDVLAGDRDSLPGIGKVSQADREVPAQSTAPDALDQPESDEQTPDDAGIDVESELGAPLGGDGDSDDTGTPETECPSDADQTSDDADREADVDNRASDDELAPVKPDTGAPSIDYSALAPSTGTTQPNGDADASEVAGDVTDVDGGDADGDVDDAEGDVGDADGDLDDAAVDTGASGVDADAAEGVVVDEADESEETTVADTDSSPGVVAGESTGIAATLAAEIRAGSVSDADLAVLRDELDLGVPKSVDVRIHRLQSRLDDLETYRAALAEFIDENGTGEELLASLREEIDAVSGALAAAEDVIDAVEGRTSVLREDLEAVDAALDDVDARLEAQATAISELDTDVSDHETRLEDLHSNVTTNASRLEDVGSDVESTTDRLGDVAESVDEQASRLDEVAAQADGNDARLDDLTDELGDVWTDVADIDTRVDRVEQVVDEDLSDLRADLDEVLDDIEELESFKQRLNQAFIPNESD